MGKVLTLHFRVSTANRTGGHWATQGPLSHCSVPLPLLRQWSQQPHDNTLRVTFSISSIWPNPQAAGLLPLGACHVAHQLMCSSKTSSPYSTLSRRREGGTRRKSCEDKSRDLGNESVCQGLQRVARKPPEARCHDMKHSHNLQTLP